VRADAVHALGVRQIFVTGLAGNGEGGLPVELRKDPTERLQCADDIVGKFSGGQYRPATGRKLFVAMAQ